MAATRTGSPPWLVTGVFGICGALAACGGRADGDWGRATSGSATAGSAGADAPAKTDTGGSRQGLDARAGIAELASGAASVLNATGDGGGEGGIGGAGALGDGIGELADGGMPAASVSTAGTSTAGVDWGGADTGGVSTGGAHTGGANAAGASTGGADTGGASTGGAALAGADTGGASTGGAALAGADTGGANTAGTNTGGAAGGTGNTGGTGTGGAPPRPKCNREPYNPAHCECIRDDGNDIDVPRYYLYARDADGDGHADIYCSSEHIVYNYPHTPQDDCDDTRADVYPGAPEICDGVDNDCDGWIDLEDGACIGDDGIEGAAGTAASAGTTGAAGIAGAAPIAGRGGSGG